MRDRSPKTGPTSKTPSRLFHCQLHLAINCFHGVGSELDRLLRLLSSNDIRYILAFVFMILIHAVYRQDLRDTASFNYTGGGFSHCHADSDGGARTAK